mgnify:CR=1 FL=1
MSHFLKDKTAIAGIGHTTFSKNSGMSELGLACQAVSRCLDDAGLPASEVDGMVTFTLDSSDEIEIARAVGLGNLNMFAQINYGGGAAVGLIQQAVMAVATGVCKNVVVWRAMNGRSGRRMGQGTGKAIASSDFIHWSWYNVYGMLTPASWVAMIANTYMNEFNVGQETLASVAMTQREFATTNPHAFGYQKPMSMEDYMASKLVATPLRVFDCCQETDGGCALLITSTEHARDLKQKPAVIRGVTQASTQGQEQMTSFYRDDLSSLPEMEYAAKRVYDMAELTPNDIDASCLYDAFTPEVVMQLESFGFCGRGEAKDFIADGHIGRGGRLPNNTHGGLLSEAYIHGVNNIAEGARLIRGQSVNQPEKTINHTLVSSGVGVPTGALILSSD